MKKIVIGCGVVALLAAVVIGSCSYFVYSSISNMPEWAKRDAAYSRYAPVVQQVEAGIAQADSMLQAASILEKSSFQPELVLVTLKNESGGDDKSKIDAFRRGGNNWTVSTYLVFNGAGYGTLKNEHGESVPVIILEGEQNLRKDGSLKYTMYLQHSETEK